MEIIDQILAVQNTLTQASNDLAEGKPVQARAQATWARVILKGIKPVAKLDQLEWGQVDAQAEALIAKAAEAAKAQAEGWPTGQAAA